MQRADVAAGIMALSIPLEKEPLNTVQQTNLHYCSCNGASQFCQMYNTGNGVMKFSATEYIESLRVPHTLASSNLSGFLGKHSQAICMHRTLTVFGCPITMHTSMSCFCGSSVTRHWFPAKNFMMSYNVGSLCLVHVMVRNWELVELTPGGWTASGSFCGDYIFLVAVGSWGLASCPWPFI